MSNYCSRLYGYGFGYEGEADAVYADDCTSTSGQYWNLLINVLVLNQASDVSPRDEVGHYIIMPTAVLRGTIPAPMSQPHPSFLLTQADNFLRNITSASVMAALNSELATLNSTVNITSVDGPQVCAIFLYYPLLIPFVPCCLCSPSTCGCPCTHE